MNLKYIEYPSFKKEIKKLYTQSFPKNERFPFWILDHSIRKGIATIQAVTENDNFIGMIHIVNCDSSYYLMYFAIDEKFRNKKYGSEILKDLKNKYGTIFLSIEKPYDEISERREQFYLRNGFYKTRFYCTEHNVTYEVLCNNKDYVITNEIHKKRYYNMSNSKIVRFCINRFF